MVSFGLLTDVCYVVFSFFSIMLSDWL